MNMTSDRKPLIVNVSQGVFIVVIMAVLAGGIACRSRHSDKMEQNGKDQKSAPPPVVMAVPARKSDVNVYLTGLGSVTASNTVTVKSRVDGQLMDVCFKEGDTVKKGARLAVIDPRPFKVLLGQAEGQMMKDQELLRNARTDLERYKILWKQDSIPKQQLDTQDALVRQYEAALKIDQSQIDNAKLQLTYSTITSPINGRTGLRLVDPGNMVHAADPGGLVLLIQLQPINVIFSIPEDSLRKVLAARKTSGKLVVEAMDRDQKEVLATGSLLTIDNQIDPSTGTVKLKAVFPNEKNELFPNQFVNARLLLEVKKDAILVPSAAVQRSPKGIFVYVVKPDKTVEMRPVKPGVNQGSDMSLESGLEEGELVVADGTDRLRDGSPVELKGQGGGDSPRKH